MESPVREEGCDDERRHDDEVAPMVGAPVQPRHRSERPDSEKVEHDKDDAGRHECELGATVQMEPHRDERHGDRVLGNLMSEKRDSPSPSESVCFGTRTQRVGVHGLVPRSTGRAQPPEESSVPFDASAALAGSSPSARPFLNSCDAEPSPRASLGSWLPPNSNTTTMTAITIRPSGPKMSASAPVNTGSPLYLPHRRSGMRTGCRSHHISTAPR